MQSPFPAGLGLLERLEMHRRERSGLLLLLLLLLDDLHAADARG